MKGRIVATELAQTLKNKTISATDNTISGIGVSNLAAQTASDKGKTFLIGNDGAFYLGTPLQNETVSALPETGNSEKIYFLSTADETHAVGLYVWNGTAYIPATAPTTVDGSTIVKSSSGALEIPTGDATKGIAVTNFKTGEILTALSASASQSDSKVLSEKATGTELAKKIAYSDDSTNKTFTFGIDADGPFYETED